MTTYTVKYKLGFFWRTVKNVQGDLYDPDHPIRILILADETRMEIPITAAFEFSPERFDVIKERMESEAGQPLQFKPGVRKGK